MGFRYLVHPSTQRSRFNTTPGRHLRLLAILLALATAAPLASAQDPYIRLREPAHASDGRPLAATAGAALVISGVAWHPSGVREVLVNGLPATLTADPPLMNFELRYIPDSDTRMIIVRAVPNTGEPFQVSYGVSLSRSSGAAPDASVRPAPPVTPPSSGAATSAGAAPSASAAPRAATGAPVATTMSGPWDGFKRRSVLYVGGAGLGLVFATRESATTGQVVTGAILAGASVVFGLFDAVRTSREANRAPGGGGSGMRGDGAFANMRGGGMRGPVDVNVGLGAHDRVVMQFRLWY